MTKPILMRPSNPNKTIKCYSAYYRLIASVLFLLITLCYKVRGQDSEIYLLQNDCIIVKINNKGAELQSIWGKISKFEYLWQGDSEYWPDRAPIMFPVNVRFRDDEFYFRNAKYDMPKMGIIKESFMTLKYKSKDEVILNFVPDNEVLQKNYPFLFDLLVRYKLIDNAILIEYTITNNDKHSMYFALGGHPGFNLSPGQRNSRENHELFFPKTFSANRVLIENSLLKDSLVPFLRNETVLGLEDDRIPNTGIFIEDPPVNKIGLARLGKEPYISLVLGNFPNVNIWSPRGYPFVCIEPMVSHHDFEDSPRDIKKKDHLIRLRPGKTVKYHYSIEINENF